MIKIKRFYFNEFRECCIVAGDETGECVIVDPGCGTAEEKAELYGYIEKEGLKPVKILLTHAHFDHVLGLTDCARKYGIPACMHPEERRTLASNGIFAKNFGFVMPAVEAEFTDLADGDTVTFGNTAFEVLHTPGHTPGGVCYLDKADKVLFSGDTLFAGSIGRTDLPDGDYDILMKSLIRLMCLDGDIYVIPGHGPATTVADEHTKNPFLQPFNLPADEA